MNDRALDRLQVLVTGVDAPASRDVVHLLVADGARVIAADQDMGKLERLERDAGLWRTTIDTAQVDLSRASEVRLWEAALRALGQLPHVMICCCGASLHRAQEAVRSCAAASDIALVAGEPSECLALLAARLLKPCLFLHAEPLRRCAFDRALAAIRHPTLRGLLQRSPGRGVFNAEAVVPYVRIASHLYSLRSGMLTEGLTTRRRRLAFAPTAESQH